ncbi:MAG: polyketide synthase dehydratase domain-containing protein, partial [Deltaproteobacteria bacterium]|nr:polyketide synthase dehydratase domain-containing protein [Deltaproteobacteria bacterium]
DLCFHFPLVRSRFDLMERAFRDHPRGYTPSQFIFPPPTLGSSVDSDEQERLLWQMDGAVESVFVASAAISGLLQRLGLKPDIATGHSAGEYTGLLVTGATRVDSDESLVRMILDVNSVYQRLYKTQSIPAVALIAVGGADPELLRQLQREHEGKLFVAMDNCHYQVVLSAAPEIAEGVMARLKSAGAVCNVLPFDRPYHTPLFEPAYHYLVESFPPIDRPRPEIQLWSCATAAPYPENLEEARRVALEQWIRPVRFRDTIEAMYESGVRIFVEAGPRGNLTSFVNDILRKRPYLATPSNVPGRSGIRQLHHALALLAAQGVPLTLDPLYERRGPERLDFDRCEKPAPARKGAMQISLALPYLKLPDGARPFAKPAGARPVAAAPALRLPALPAPAAEQPTAIDGGEDASFAPEMQSYFETMEQFLEIQEDLMHAFLADPAEPLRDHSGDAVATPQSAEGASQRPLLGEIVFCRPGESLTALRRLDPAKDLFLQHHTLGGQASLRDRSLTALPIMPLTMTIEMAAEAAEALAPGMKVVALQEIRASRWIDLGEGARTVQINAWSEAADRVRVTITEPAGDAGAIPDVKPDANPAGLLSAPPIFEATARLAAEFPAPPDANPFAPPDARPSRWNAATLYKLAMFHGPSFRGVEHVDAWSKEGVRARLLTLPSDRLFASEPAPRFALDPALLDAAGQLVAFWNGEKDLRGVNSTPFRIDAINLYGPPPPPHMRLDARARIQRLAPDHLRADIEVDGPDGRPYFGIRGWEDRCFEFPEPIVKLTWESEGLTLSERWKAPEAPLGNPAAFRCRRVHGWPRGTFEGSGMLWQKQVAHLVLSRDERDVWRALRKPPRARTEWLFARAAVKDAVCQLARENHGIELLPADVEITADELGRPRVAPALAQIFGPLPAVSMAHGRGIAVGIAAEGELDLEVGIDVERMRILEPGFERIAFSEEDLKILGDLDDAARAEWWLRAWCAKEAAAKALGTGLAGKPRGFVLRKLDESSGLIAIEIGGELARLRPALGGAILDVYTLREDDLIMAVTTCRRSDK